jgi:hypothetical protein
MAVRKTKLRAPKVEGESKGGLTPSPLVFISHDSRDADLAAAFNDLLTDASGGMLRAFRSSDKKGATGIEYGQEWYGAIMQKLTDATDVVALLTPHSIDRPWILYEVGVAKGKMADRDRVLGVTFGVSLSEAATGPFAQFQNSQDDEDSLTGLVLQLIRRNPQATPREEAVRRQIQEFRKNIQRLAPFRSASPVPVKQDVASSVVQFFEEIKVLVRDIPERVAKEVGSRYPSASTVDGESAKYPRWRELLRQAKTSSTNVSIASALMVELSTTDGTGSPIRRLTTLNGLVRVGALDDDVFTLAIPFAGAGVAAVSVPFGQTEDIWMGMEGMLHVALRRAIVRSKHAVRLQ